MALVGVEARRLGVEYDFAHALNSSCRRARREDRRITAAASAL
jgi:hypothetical protein